MNQDSLLPALQQATQLALTVGAYLKSTLYKGPIGAKGKSPADLEAERRLRLGLSQFSPNWGIRVEEEPEYNTQAKTIKGETWLIDPNDGTSAYLKGQRGASVSIGLIREGVPVLGVVFAYAAPNGKGDLFTWAEGCGPLMRNGKAIDKPWNPFQDRGLFFVSNSAHNKGLSLIHI